MSGVAPPFRHPLPARPVALVPQDTSLATWRRFAFWAVAHAALMVAADKNVYVASLHAWTCLAYGLYLVAAGRSNLDLARFAAYAVGMDVVWRMTSAICFWEMGKYTVAAVLGLALLRSRPIRPTAVSGWYIALLLPSALVTASELGFTLARKQVSFNLSGPLTISVCVAFFSRCGFTSAQWSSVIRAALIPLLSMWAIVVTGIASAEQLTFTTESNVTLSGGFGPNQVSTLFGMGAMLSVVAASVLEPKANRIGRYSLVTIALMLAAQAALTFSRSGLYLAVLSLACAAVLSLKNPRLRNAYIVSSIVAYLVAVYVIYPRLDEFTGGKLTERFSETQGTGRELLIQSDLDLWMRNPIFGVGPGLATEHRKEFFQALPAHCEITRLLAEHGLFGFAALILLAVALVKRLLAIRDPQFRSLAVACSAFGVLCMISNAMRVAAPGFLIGVAFASDYVAARRPDYRQPALR